MGNKRRLINLILVFSSIVFLAGAFYFLNERFKFFADTSDFELYVSNNGNDSWSGGLKDPNLDKSDGPLATIERARDRVREIKQSNQINRPITINLRQGSYFLPNTFSLDERDSGLDGSPVTYRSYPGEKATITSGKVLETNWISYRDGVFVTDISGEIDNFNTLFVDQQRATRARTPNKGSYFETRYDADIIGSNRKTMFAYNPGDIDPSWTNVSDMQVVSLQRWLSTRNYLSSIDREKVIVSGENPTGGNSDWGANYAGFYSDYDGKNRYFIDNVFEKLDAPGEWYFNKSEKKLYYMPARDKEIKQSVFIVPTLEKLIDISSSKSREIELNLSSGFSVSGWVKTTASKSHMYFIANAGSSNGFRFGLMQGRIHFLVGDGVGGSGANTYIDSYCSSQRYNDNQWHMITGVFDLQNKRVTCYVDNVVTGTVELPMTYQDLLTTLPNIARPPAGSLFEGSLDEIYLAERVLSVGEISALYSTNSLDNPALHVSFDENYDRDTGLGLDASNNYTCQVFNFDNLEFLAGRFGKSAAFSGTSVETQPYYKFLSVVDQLPEMRPNNIIFKDLNFAYTDWSVLLTGYYSLQGGAFTMSEPTINLRSTSSISFINNSFSGLGGFAISSDYSDKLVINKNNFFDLGGGAVKIPNDSPAFYLPENGNQISENIINDVSRVFHDAIGIIVMHSANNLISRNTISNIPYAGISVGYSWHNNPSVAKNNIIKDNIVYDAMQMLNDGGGIYTVGNQITGKIENNIVYDILLTSHHKSTFGINGIYLDGGSTGVNIESNLLANIYGHAFHIGGNIEQNVVNNIVYNPNAGYPPLRAPNVALDARSGAKFLRNVVYLQRGATNFYNLKNPSYSATGGWPEESDYNLIDNGQDTLDQLAALRERNLDLHSVVAPADFVDPDTKDFCLKPTSVAISELGFQEFPNCKIPTEAEYSLVSPDIRNLPNLIPDSTPPTIISTNLSDNQVITVNPYLITAKVTDDIKVEKVKFYVNNNLIGTSTLPDLNRDYETLWDTSKYQGEVKIIAYDSSNNKTEKTVKNISVSIKNNNQSNPYPLIFELPKTGENGNYSSIQRLDLFSLLECLGVTYSN